MFNSIKLNIIKISTENNGQRIDNFLIKNFKFVPKSMIYRIIRIGKVRINNKKVLPKYKIKKNDEISLPLIKNFCREKKKNLIFNIDINKNDYLYEDDYLIILNKPQGLPVHGGSGVNLGIIETLRKNYYSKKKFLELVHRLDKETSGVLLIAKKRLALTLLHKQIREKNLEKKYIAVMYGKLKLRKKIVKAPLSKNTHFNKKRIVHVNYKYGRYSETHFQVKKYFKKSTLVSITLITGRTHQIRVHAKHIGHPIIFDDKYGNKITNKEYKDFRKKRLFLHAVSVKFTHPITQKLIKVIAPIDLHFKNFLKYLKTKK